MGWFLENATFGNVMMAICILVAISSTLKFVERAIDDIVSSSKENK